MERLFSLSSRLYDLLENQGGLEQLRVHDPEPLQELNLDRSTEVLLSAERAFTYADLYAMLGSIKAVAWLTPHTAVVRTNGEAVHAWNQLQLDESCGFHFSADGKAIIAMALSPEHLLEICDFILRLLAVSVVHSLRIDEPWCSTDGAIINAATLAYLMEQCQSLKVLTLVNQETDEEDHCRVLGDFSRPDLEIVLRYCTITDAGASALAEVLGRNQGPTKLDCCVIENVVLADGLRGNSRLTTLSPIISSSAEVGDRQVLAIVGALRENKGLVELNLESHGFNMSDEALGAICNSFKAHPTLEVLNLSATFRDDTATPAVLKSRIQVLVDMLKVNMSIHTIHLDTRYCRHELFRGSVIPYLETNRFRPRLLAIQRARPIPYRSKVLGRALLAVRTDAIRFWMLLSGNAEVAFPSGTSIAAAATAADAANPSTANVAAVAASVNTSPLTTTTTGSLPTAAAHTTGATSAVISSTTSDALVFATTTAAAAAANVASPSAHQKRKSHP